MSVDKEDIKDCNFFIVPIGFQPMGTKQFTFTDTVSNENAIRVGKNIFCTEKWKENLLKSLK